MLQHVMLQCLLAIAEASLVSHVCCSALPCEPRVFHLKMLSPSELCHCHARILILDVLPGSELATQQPQNSCPEREWLPEECIGSLREKSKKVFDHCQLFFSETGYSMDLLTKCGIVASSSP